MGDIIHTFPALTDAQKHYPDIKFDWIVEEAFQEIPYWHATVNKVIPIALRRWRKDLKKNWQKKEIKNFFANLRQEKYDCIIDAQGLMKSSVLTCIANKNPSCKTHGYDWKSIREPLASLIYNCKYDISKQQHAIERIRKLFAYSLNYNLEYIEQQNNTKCLHAVNCDVDYGIKSSIIKLCENPLITSITQQFQTAKYLVFIHATSRKDKCWHIKNWQTLCDIAKQNNYNVLLPWGNDAEHQQAQDIALNNSNTLVLPKLKLNELAVVLLNAKCVIAVDTGLGHLSSALETPTISLYGPTSPELIGSIGKTTKYFTDLDKTQPQDVWKGIIKII